MPSRITQPNGVGSGHSSPFSGGTGALQSLLASAPSVSRWACLLALLTVLANLHNTVASELEGKFFTAPVQITMGAAKAGEGYFSPDSRMICYQAVPHGYPFYQIYLQPIDLAAPRPTTPLRVSTGRGRTTCSWFSPDGSRLLFASSHLDPAIDATEAEAIRQAEEDAALGRRRRYAWDFDPWMEIFTAAIDSGGAADDGQRFARLTEAAGYDAECSFSPDGSQILFVSDRDGDPDIYVMKSDGSDVRQLTNEDGYDGGPFFSPDGRWIAYRTDRLEKDQLHIHVMRADGSGDTAVTGGTSVEWAPYWHPAKPWLIWTGADHSDPTARPNYDLWLSRYEEDPATGQLRFSPPVRLTDHPSADVLPVFSPEGRHLLWTTGRSEDRSSQLWLAALKIDAIDAALDAAGTSHELQP
jgi:TolB protein